MKAFSKRIITSVLVFLMLMTVLPFFSMPVCASDGNNQVVRVGFFAYPGYHEFDGNVRSGYGVDFLSLLQRYTNFRYEYAGYENSWEEMQQMLLDGEIDFVTSARKTPEREELFDFSEPIGESYAQINVRLDDERFAPNDFRALNGITIGLISGNSRNADLERFAQEYGFTYRSVEYATSEELEQALRDRKVDAAASGSLRKFSDERTVARFAPEDFYVIVKKGNTGLLDEINYGIGQMNVNEGNWKDNLHYKHYEEAAADVLSFTKREKEYIKAVQNGEKTITVSAQPDRDPYSFVENGELTGIIPDYFAHLMEMAGLPYTVLVPEDRVEFQTWTLTNYTDVIMDCRYTSAPVSAPGFEFGIITEPYMEMTTSRVTQKGFTGEIHSIATVDSQGGTYIEEPIAGDAEYILVSSREEAMQYVKDGKADAAYVYYIHGGEIYQ